jgi:hypothetical protein
MAGKEAAPAKPAPAKPALARLDSDGDGEGDAYEEYDDLELSAGGGGGGNCKGGQKERPSIYSAKHVRVSQSKKKAAAGDASASAQQ